MSEETPILDYSPTSFSSGRMDFTWEELSDDELAQAYADWAAAKGLIGGDPRLRPNSERLPSWAEGQPFFRALALDDPNADTGDRLRDSFTRHDHMEVEIGFGRGDFLLDRARRFPGRLFIGYDTKTKAARLLLPRIEGYDLSNLWISDDDVRFNLPRVVDDQTVDVVHVLFPDPWWKDQHRVKRLFSPPFVDLLAQKICRGGVLHFKSDVREYGELVKYLVERNDDFADNDLELAERIGDTAQTHREYWCMMHKRPVYSYFFERK